MSGSSNGPAWSRASATPNAVRAGFNLRGCERSTSGSRPIGGCGRAVSATSRTCLRASETESSMTHAIDELRAHEFGLTRVFDAQRDLVFKVWTDPRYVALWWGVDGATNPHCELDVRVGGAWRI